MANIQDLADQFGQMNNLLQGINQRVQGLQDGQADDHQRVIDLQGLMNAQQAALNQIPGQIAANIPLPPAAAPQAPVPLAGGAGDGDGVGHVGPGGGPGQGGQLPAAVPDGAPGVVLPQHAQPGFPGPVPQGGVHVPRIQSRFLPLNPSKDFELYSGCGKDAPQVFLNRFLTVHHLLPEAELCAKLPYYLKSEAKELWESLTLAERNNWPIVSQRLIDRFSEEVYINLRQADFHNIKQLPGESILDFTGRIRTGVESAYAQQPAAERERMASRCFINGISRQLLPWIPIRHTTSLASLSHSALEATARGLPSLIQTQPSQQFGQSAFGAGQGTRVVGCEGGEGPIGNAYPPSAPPTPSLSQRTDHYGQQTDISSLCAQVKSLTKAFQSQKPKSNNSRTLQ